MHFSLLADFEPVNYDLELSNKIWKNAMIEELDAINRNNTRELTKQK